MAINFGRVYRALDAAKNVAISTLGKNRIEEISIYNGYSEPGYHGDCVALGNWNNIVERNKFGCSDSISDNTPSRLAKVLEKLGAEIEWSDEWTSCSCCDKLVRTVGNGYSWKPSYSIRNDEVICFQCLDPAEHLEFLEGKHKLANTIDTIDPAEFGYIKVEQHRYSIFSYNRESPADLAKSLRKKNIDRFLFNLDNVDQFNQEYSLWIHESEKNILESLNESE